MIKFLVKCILLPFVFVQGCTNSNKQFAKEICSDLSTVDTLTLGLLEEKNLTQFSKIEITPFTDKIYDEEITTSSKDYYWCNYIPQNIDGDYNSVELIFEHNVPTKGTDTKVINRLVLRTNVKVVRGVKVYLEEIKF